MRPGEARFLPLPIDVFQNLVLSIGRGKTGLECRAECPVLREVKYVVVGTASWSARLVRAPPRAFWAEDGL